MESNSDIEVEDQSEALLGEASSEVSEDKKRLSTVREIGIIFTILSLQFISLCADSIMFPVFPAIALGKGFNNTHMTCSHRHTSLYL